MADNRFDLELGLDFSKVTEALQQIKSQFTGTSAEFQKIANKFKDSFNTMTNAIKLYGIESSQAKTATKAMERAMVELTKNGVNTASVGFQQLNSQIGPLASKMTEAGASVKKSNLQYTNLALVLQDLPYGFRGIQNNLPAVIGGFAGMTGGIYLATSAIIAFATAVDNGMIKFRNSITAAELQQKSFNEILEKSKDSYTEVKTQVMLLNDQVAEAAGKKDLERKAVKDYNDTIGESLGKLKTFKEVQASLIDQGDKYIDYIFKLNMANTAASKVAEESANMLIASFKKPLDFVDNIDKLFAYQFNIFGNLTEAATGSIKKLYEAGVKNQQEAIQGFGKSAVAAQEVMKLFREQAKEAKKLLNFGTFDDKEGDATRKKNLKEYQDNLKKTDKLMSEMRKRAALGMNQGTSPIADSFEQDIKNAEKEEQDRLAFQIRNQAERSKKTLALIKEQYQTEVNEAEGSYEKIKIAQENMAAGLNAAYMNDTLTNEDRHKAFIDLTTKQTKAALDNANKLMAQTVQIGIGIMNALGPALDLLLEKGADIGEVLSKAFQDVLKKLVKVIIAASIALLIMSALGLVSAGKLGATFGNMVAGGMGLGSGLFGGGAGTGADATKATNAINTIQTTPAGDNNGQFVLRGNDLVLALNRSETSLNLRRGS